MSPTAAPDAAPPRCRPRARPGRRRAAAAPRARSRRRERRAESAIRPSFVTPTSTEMMSPSRARYVAGDAVDDHLVRRDARRGREALVALRGRDAAVGADVLLGDPVELDHRDAGLEPLADVRERVGDDAPARAISSISCAHLRMITRRPRTARAPAGSRRRPRRPAARRAAARACRRRGSARRSAPSRAW